MWRRFGCGVIAVAVAFGSFGCAEIDRRGGFLDQVQDAILFRADTKSHRLLRAYVLVGTLMAVARRQGHNDVDQTSIGGALEQSLVIVAEMYECVYSQKLAGNTNVAPIPGTSEAGLLQCQFFDEKMSRLEYALYRLALITLLNAESRQHLAEVRDRLVGTLPVASDALRAVTGASTVVKSVSTVIDDLIKLNFHGLGTVAYLLPIYRDALELDMRVIIDSLTISNSCPLPHPAVAIPENPFEAPYLSTIANPCVTLGYAEAIFQNGNGDLRRWRAFIKALNSEIQQINALPIHFAVVDRWIWASCVGTIGEKRCEEIGKKLKEQEFKFLSHRQNPVGPYSAKLAPTSVIARSLKGMPAAEQRAVAASLERPATRPQAKAGNGTAGQVAVAP